MVSLSSGGSLPGGEKRQDEDRTGLVTVHPELLDSEGRITEEALLTVRFSGEDDLPETQGTDTE